MNIKLPPVAYPSLNSEDEIVISDYNAKTEAYPP